MTAYDAHPIVMWEVTRACDLHCHNCTIRATERHGANELTTYEAYKTIDQIASLGPREFIITGGDPLEREDVVQIVNYASRRGLDPTLVASPTSRLTAAAVARLHGNGLKRIVFSIDGATAGVHQSVRGVIGTFVTTLHAMHWATASDLQVEVNTLVTRRNAHDLAGIADLLRPRGITRWNLHFLVPMTAAAQSETLVAGEAERLFATIDDIRSRETFSVRVVEAPHYRRHRLLQELDSRLDNATSGHWPNFGSDESNGMGTRRDLTDSALDGARGFVFISHAGDVRASEFLLFNAGNLRYRPLDAIYRSSDLFVALRDPANLKGKCGLCEFRILCGGSRARAWATGGDIFGDDPLCSYEPGAPMPLPTATPRQPEASS